MRRGVGNIIFRSLSGPVEHWKEIRPWRAEFVPEGKHFVSGNSLIFIFGEAAKLR
jgi:hypothetical protein